MKRKIAIILISIAILATASVSANAVTEIVRLDDRIDIGILKDEELYRLRAMRGYASEAFGISIHFHLLKTMDGSAGDYAAGVINDIERKDPTSENLFLLAYCAETEDAAIALSEKFTQEFSDLDIKSFLEPFNNKNDILPMRFFNSMILVFDALAEGHSADEFERGLFGHIAPYMQYREAEKAGEPLSSMLSTTQIIVITVGIALLITEIAIFIIRGKKSSAVKKFIPLIAVITICTGVLGYLYLPGKTILNDPLPISVITTPRKATAITAEQIESLKVAQTDFNLFDHYKESVKVFPNVIEGCDYTNEYRGGANGSYYTRYISADIAEQYYEFHTKCFLMFYDHDTYKFERIEGKNFKLFSIGAPNGEAGDTKRYFYVYYLLIDDAVYTFAPYQNELQMYRELVDAMDLDIYYLKETITITKY